MKLLLSIIIFLISPNVFATVVLHDESTDGDLSFMFIPDFGEHGAGRYIVNGSTSWGGHSLCITTVCNFDLDTFVLGVSPGLTVDASITAEIELIMPSEQSSNISQLEILLEIAGIDLVWGNEAIDNPETRSVSTTANAIGGDLFFQSPTWSLLYNGPNLLEGERIDLNYSVSIDVSAVPLPGAIYLFTSAVVLLIGANRSKRPKSNQF